MQVSENSSTLRRHYEQFAASFRFFLDFFNEKFSSISRDCKCSSLNMQQFVNFAPTNVSMLVTASPENLGKS